jgi:hypothetical protein
VTIDTTETTDAEPEYVYTSTVRKKYGLTPGMIDELGPPDRIVENPHYSRGDAYLYRVERVEAWVAQNPDRLEKARAQRVNRSAAAKKAHERRQQDKLRQQDEEQRRRERLVTEAAVTVRPFPDTLLDDARATFRVDAQTGTLTRRQLVAHVRQNLTNYLDLLRGLRDDRAYYALSDMLQRRVNSTIENSLRHWLAARPDDLTFKF